MMDFIDEFMYDNVDIKWVDSDGETISDDISLINPIIKHLKNPLDISQNNGQTIVRMGDLEGSLVIIKHSETHNID